MILGKPIIYTIPKGVTMFENFEPGISCKPNDPISLFEAITKMINLSHEARFNMASKSYDYVSKNFLYSNLANILVDVIKELD